MGFIYGIKSKKSGNVPEIYFPTSWLSDQSEALVVDAFRQLIHRRSESERLQVFVETYASIYVHGWLFHQQACPWYQKPPKTTK